jgi:hypothetical protein
VQQAAAAGAEDLSDEDLLMGQEEPPGVWDYEAGGRAVFFACAFEASCCLCSCWLV